MKYVSSWVVPVPKNKIDEYRRKARKFGKIWKEHGALEYVECVADDVKKGKVTSFPQSVSLEAHRDGGARLARFQSKSHHDRVIKNAMGDPRMQKLMHSDEMLFDGMRMFWGGFEVMVRL